MKRGSPIRQRLAAIGLLGIPLLTYPMLSMPEGMLGGLPSTYLYVFGVWAGLIVLALKVAERKGK